MIKIYEDGSIYIGELKDGKRNGKGDLYFLDDIKSAYKLSGMWENDELHGWVTEYTHGRVEQGFWDHGKKSGSFMRVESDGTVSACHYEEGKMSAPIDVYGENSIFEEKFGKRRYKNAIYIGDLENGQPYGYGIMLFVHHRKIIEKQFGNYIGGNLIESINLTNITEKTL